MVIEGNGDSEDVGAFFELDADWEPSERSDPVELTGGIGDRGVSSRPSSADDGLHLRFTFVVWRVGDGQIREEPCTIEGDIDDLPGSESIDAVGAESVITVRAWFEKTDGATRARLDSIVNPEVTDPELARRLEAVLHPQPFDDDQFGTFEQEWDTFETETDWNGTTVTLILETRCYERKVESALDVARSLWADQSVWDDRIRRAAGDHLHSLGVHADDEEPPSRAACRQSLTLCTVSVSPDGSFRFWYDDGLAGTGHSIITKGTVTDGPTEVSWEG